MSKTDKKEGGVNVMVLGIGLALIIPMLVLFGYSFGNNPREIPSVLVGQPAPGFNLVDIDGNTWELDKLRGKPVVLNFWSTWCGPCKQEHGLLQRTASANPDVQFLGVIYSDTPEKCRRYLNQAGTTYNHLVDPAGATSIDYGVGGVPETYFIDADGVIVHKEVGPLNSMSMRILLAKVRG